MNKVTITALNGNQVSIHTLEITRLEAALTGHVIFPHSTEYDEVRAVWNRSIDKKPALIIRCVDEKDVVTSIKFVSCHGLMTAIRGGGHNVAGHASCESGVVIDLSRLNQVTVDVAKGTVTAGGGATIRDVDRASLAHNLAVPLGIVSETGIGGLTLCGGHSWLTRKYGFACDNLVSAQIVTAEGDRLTADEHQNSDLFWAIRGGGGNFGVVTAFEFKAHSINNEVTFCGIFYPIDDAEKVMKSWRDHVSVAPDEFTSQVAIWSIPCHGNFPAELHGKEVVIISGVHIGSLEDGEQFIEPLRKISAPLLDLSGPLCYDDVQQAFDPYFNGKRERFNFWKSHFLNELTNESIECIVHRGKQRPDPWTLIPIRHMGGSGSNQQKGKNPLGGREAKFMLSIDTSWESQRDSVSAIRWTREFWDEMRGAGKGEVYLNFVGEGEDSEHMMRSSFGDEIFERLCLIKSRYDSANQFRLNQNIPPTKQQQ